MIFKPLKKKKKFGLNQTSTPSQSPTVKQYFIYIYLGTLKFRLFIKMKHYSLVQSIEVGFGGRSRIFFARTYRPQTLSEHLPTPTDR